MPKHPASTRDRRNRRSGDRDRGHLVVSGLTYSNASAGSTLDISFVARPGTMTHIVGSSTTESATLLGLLVGLYPPEGGELCLDEKPVVEIPTNSARASVVLVLQDPWIMSGSVADNIAFGDPGVDREEIEAVAALACLDDLIADLPAGLDTPLGADGGEILGIGQRRLIALARALLRDPAVLLIEDPFRELTTREETRMIKAVNGAGQDRTTIVTTQHFDPALLSTDQVLLLEGGIVTPIRPDAQRVPLPGLPPHPDPAAPPPQPRTEPLPPPPPPLEPEQQEPEQHESDHHPSVIPDPVPLLIGAHPTPLVAEIDPVLLVAGGDLGNDYRAASLLNRTDLIETWLAWHRGSSTIVEAKVARSESVAERARSELTLEYERARRLVHPGIARPIAAHLDDDQPFAVYERVAGLSLRQLLESEDETNRIDIAAVGASLARTLAFLHRHDTVHLGLGPDVVKLTEDGAMITDLRDALPIGVPPDPTNADHERGGVAPEQLGGDPAAPPMDVFALGSLLFQVATGTLLTANAGPDVSDIDSFLPAPVADVVASMLAPDPERRPTAAEVLGQLRPHGTPLDTDRRIEEIPLGRIPSRRIFDRRDSLGGGVSTSPLPAQRPVQS